MKIITVFLYLTVVILISCQHQAKLVSHKELITYLNNKDNGLVQQEEVNGLTVKVTYHPTDLLVQMEAQSDTSIHQGKLVELKSRYKDNYYFVLSFSKNGKEAIRQLGSFSGYSDMVQVLAFNMNRFVNLTTTNLDTLPLTDFLFDQTYGMSNANSVMLSFSRKNLKPAEELVINLSECGFQTGNLKFSFKRKDLVAVPGLDFSNAK